MSEKLKQCPFCGGEAMLYRRDRACCADDECAGWMGDPTVEAWNRRAPDMAAEIEALKAQREALRQALAGYVVLGVGSCKIGKGMADQGLAALQASE